MTPKELLIEMWKDPWYGLAVIITLAIMIPASFYAMKERRQDKYQTWSQWMEQHEKTCPECSRGPDGPMCVEAFTRMQAALKRGEDL